MTEPDRERVEAYEKALGCDQVPDWCYVHQRRSADLGCPVAVAAARVEAERLVEVEARIEKVRAFAQMIEHDMVDSAYGGGKRAVAVHVLRLITE